MSGIAYQYDHVWNQEQGYYAWDSLPMIMYGTRNRTIISGIAYQYDHVWNQEQGY